MKVVHIKDINGFFETVDKCKGKVELITGEGDRLNLKSKLSQYVSMANIFSNGEIPELEITASMSRVIDIMASGSTKGNAVRALQNRLVRYCRQQGKKIHVSLDVDDLILNLLGMSAGFLLFRLYAEKKKSG